MSRKIKSKDCSDPHVSTMGCAASLAKLSQLVNFYPEIPLSTMVKRRGSKVPAV